MSNFFYILDKFRFYDKILCSSQDQLYNWFVIYKFGGHFFTKSSLSILNWQLQSYLQKQTGI